MTTNRFKSSVFATALALGCALPAYADIGSQMETMFNSLSNTTMPGAYETTARGVLTGGGVTVRNEIAGLSLGSIKFPTISAGCGGIDIFGGSFSFISADQLVEFMKNIASNAVGYAFQMALENACPQCKAIISDFQALSQAINSMNINSCEAAEGIVTTLMGNESATGKKLNRMGQNLSTSFGNLVDDISAAYYGTQTSGESTAKKLKDNPDNAVTKKMNVNVAFKSAKSAGASAIFSSGSEKENIEFMMGLTGTVVFKWPDGTNGQNVNDVEFSPTPFPKVTSFEEFVEGNSKTGKAVAAYSCDDATDCLNPTTTSVASFKGLKTLFIDKVLDPTVNIPRLIRSGNNVTDTAASVLDFIPQSVMYYIRMLALSVGEEAAKSFIYECAPILAAKIAKEHADTIYSRIEQSLRVLDKDIDTEKAFKMISDSRKAFNDEYSAYLLNHGGEKDMIVFFNALMKNGRLGDVVSATPKSDLP